MDDGATDNRDEWNYSAVLIGLLGGIVLQSIVFPCLCHRGTVKMQMAACVDAIVLIRLIVARIRKERDRGWIFYMVLPVLIVPVIELVTHFWSPH